MFASGRWVGYWTMEPILEDPMQNVHDVNLAFMDGRVGGGGVDMVGEFILAGTASGDEVHIKKSYIEMHAVWYDGKRDDKGCIVGQWRIEGDGRGHFLWVPPVVDDPTPLAEEWYRGVKRVRYWSGPRGEKAPVDTQPLDNRSAPGKGCLSAVLVGVMIVVLVLGAL